MPLSLRIPPKKEELIKKTALKAGKTKSAFILEAVDEKLGLVKNREKTIRELAGCLSQSPQRSQRFTFLLFFSVYSVRSVRDIPAFSFIITLILRVS